MYQQQVDALHPTVADVLSQANNSCGHVAVITWMTLQFFPTLLHAQRLVLLALD